MKRSKPLLILSLTGLFAWIWVNHPQLAPYSLQLVALGAIIILVRSLVKNSSFGLLDLTIINGIISLLVFSTGGPSSPLFFLFYFLLFALAFLLDPESAIIFSLILTFLLTPQMETWSDFGEAFSLVLVAPIAFFFGQEYLKNLTNQKQIKTFQKKLIRNQKALASQEKDVLLWLSLNLRNTLAEISEITAQLLSDLAHLSPQQKLLLKKMRRKIRKLLKEAEILEKKVDRVSDE